MLWFHVKWTLILKRAKAISVWQVDEGLVSGSETGKRTCGGRGKAHVEREVVGRLIGKVRRWGTDARIRHAGW
jgi:hypothetical protein